MPDPRLQKLAQVLVCYSLSLKKNDFFMIRAFPQAAPLVVEVFREALAAEAHPYTRLQLEELQEILLKKGSEEQLQYVPELDRFAVEKFDAYLGIWGESNTKALSNVDPQRQALAERARFELEKRFLERAARGELRWCGTQFPTHSAAQDAEMSLSEYEDFVYSAGKLHQPDPVGEWQKLARQQEEIVKYLCDKTILHITGQDTDLKISIAGRKWINCCGKENFPDGEVFTGPVENSAEGRITFSFPAVYGGREVNGVSLEFKQGKVVRATATKNEQFLHSMIAMDQGASFLGELAIGTNYDIQRFTKNTLFDEKIGGTVHLALGASYPETGGKNESALHWDMICDLRTGGEITANHEVFYRNGEFLIA